jgi:hypothetical protein
MGHGLGDSHNFGRRVLVQGAWVKKPRSVFWEWLLLGESPLRKLFDELARGSELGAGAFEFLPTLDFRRPRAVHGGEVERLALEPLPAPSRVDRARLARTAGRALALYAWLGLGDLHWENIALGVDAAGHLVLAPLDIEMMLADFRLPTETRLLPAADPEYGAVYQHACGFRRILPYLGKPVAAEELLTLVGAYRQMLGLLARCSSKIAHALLRLPGLDKAPLRVTLRGTDEYVNAASAPPWPPLLPAESEQLARGDIPYFFQLYGRAGIHYFANRALTEVRTLPMRGDVPRPPPLLRLPRGLAAPSRRTLGDEGTLALASTFDHPSLEGKHAADGLSLTFGGRSLTLALPNGQKLNARRGSRALVESIYSPCRCGEVRSVLVPPVTRCTAGRGAA